MVFSIKNLISGNVGGLVGGGGDGFKQTLNKANIMGTTDVTCTADIYARLGNYSVPAQHIIHLGNGVAGVRGSNYEEIGKLQLHMHDDTATNSIEEAGMFKLGMTNYGETLFRYPIEERSEALGGGLATANLARNLQIPLPEITSLPAILTKQDSKVVVEFKSDATDVVVAVALGTGAFDVWSIPITIYQEN